MRSPRGGTGASSVPSASRKPRKSCSSCAPSRAPTASAPLDVRSHAAPASTPLTRYLPLLLATAIGCSTPSRVMFSGDQGPSIQSSEDLSRLHPLAERQNISPVLLRRTAALSCHFIQIRDREIPHVH